MLLGKPDMDRICTSHIERDNLHIRMTIRRMTRLTNAFSKKLENHEAMIALAIGYYNFCWKHGTLGTSPAVAAGLTDHIWTVRELLEEMRLKPRWQQSLAGGRVERTHFACYSSLDWRGP